MDIDLWHRLRLGRGAVAEQLVINWRRNARSLAADRALRIAADIKFAKLYLERIEMEQPPDQRLADIEDELERFISLQRADDPRQHAEHPCFRAVRHRAGRRRLGKEAAITGATEVRRKDRRLSIEPK